MWNLLGFLGKFRIIRIFQKIWLFLEVLEKYLLRIINEMILKMRSRFNFRRPIERFYGQEIRMKRNIPKHKAYSSFFLFLFPFLFSLFSSLSSFSFLSFFSLPFPFSFTAAPSSLHHCFHFSSNHTHTLWFLTLHHTHFVFAHSLLFKSVKLELDLPSLLLLVLPKFPAGLAPFWTADSGEQWPRRWVLYIWLFFKLPFHSNFVSHCSFPCSCSFRPATIVATFRRDSKHFSGGPWPIFTWKRVSIFYLMNFGFWDKVLFEVRVWVMLKFFGMLMLLYWN